MAILHISEYSEVTKAAGGYPIQVGKEPSLSTQKVVYTTAVQCARFEDSTKFIRVVADADAYIKFGVGPTATANSMLLPSGIIEYFGIDREKAPLLSVYDGSS